MKIQNPSLKIRGFTMVEMLVAIFVFTVVMIVSMAAILSTLNANKKTQSTQLVMDNIDFAVESMVRTLRTGMTYHCDFAVQSPPRIKPNDCVNGANSIMFEHAKGSITNPGDNYVYKLNITTNQIERSTDSGVTFIPITASNIKITNVNFYVTSSDPTDEEQPRIILSVQGEAGDTTNARTSSIFNLQTLITQRLLDIP